MKMKSMKSLIEIENMVLVVVALMLLFFIFSATLFFSTSEAIPLKTVVRVINTVGNGIPLIIHCWSSDDDLGYHTLQFNQFYEWHFRPNIWGTTKFICYLECSKGNGTYDIFRYDRDVGLCDTKCFWYVKPQEGPCLQSIKPDKQFCYPWGWHLLAAADDDQERRNRSRNSLAW